MGWHGHVHLNEVPEESIPLAGKRPRKRRRLHVAQGGGIQQRDLARALRCKIEVPHEGHGVIVRSPDTFLPSLINLVNESRGRPGAKTEVMNKKKRHGVT